MEFNFSIPFGLIRQIPEKQDDPEFLALFLKTILPGKNDDDINNMTIDEIFEIIKKFFEEFNKRNIELKKKLSGL